MRSECSKAVSTHSSQMSILYRNNSCLHVKSCLYSNYCALPAPTLHAKHQSPPSLETKNQAHTLDGIILGRSPTSNAILVYNPRNQRYYEPDSYKIDAYRLPSSVYPTIIYDGGLFVSLHRGDVPAISEPYPPGTRVEEPSSSNDSISRSGTVVDIPMDPNLTPQYLVQFDDGTTKSFPASKMASLIPPPRPSSSDSSHLLPPFLRLNSKVTFEHEGRYHKGFLSKTPDGPYCFIYKSHINKKHPDWSVPLPNLTTNWQDLCMDGILIPGHSSGSFLRDPSSASRDPSSASMVSAASLLRACPRSLLSALAPTHPDRDTWLASFREEKDGIKSQDTYDVLTLEQYRAYRAKGAPRAIPTMCCRRASTGLRPTWNARPCRIFARRSTSCRAMRTHRPSRTKCSPSASAMRLPISRLGSRPATRSCSARPKARAWAHLWHFTASTKRSPSSSAPLRASLRRADPSRVDWPRAYWLTHKMRWQNTTSVTSSTRSPCAALSEVSSSLR